MEKFDAHEVAEKIMAAIQKEYKELKTLNVMSGDISKKNKQNADSSAKQFEQTPDSIERANLILSERKPAGIQWEILLDGKQVTQYSYFVNNASNFCVGTEAIDGPDILLNRDYYIYLCVSYDEESDSYLVIQDFDGPIRSYPHGEKLIYGIDSFTLL